MSELETQLVRSVRVLTWSFVAWAIFSILRLIWLVWEAC